MNLSNNSIHHRAVLHLNLPVKCECSCLDVPCTPYIISTIIKLGVLCALLQFERLRIKFRMTDCHQNVMFWFISMSC